jgi:hypothetical protein
VYPRRKKILADANEKGRSALIEKSGAEIFKLKAETVKIRCLHILLVHKAFLAKVEKHAEEAATMLSRLDQYRLEPLRDLGSGAITPFSL